MVVAASGLTSREYVLERLMVVGLDGRLYAELSAGYSPEQIVALNDTLFRLILDELVYVQVDRRGRAWVRSRAPRARPDRMPA